MNARQLEKLGIPRHAANQAIRAIQLLAESPDFDKRTIKDRLRLVAENPQLFLGDAVLDGLARELTESDPSPEIEPIGYRTWGTNIDEGAHQQMKDACRIPAAVGAALMPDAHIGYGRDSLCRRCGHRLPHENLHSRHAGGDAGEAI